MGEDDCPTKIKRDIKEQLDELEFVKRKETYSQTIGTLVAFYKDHKKEFIEWTKKKNQKR